MYKRLIKQAEMGLSAVSQATPPDSKHWSQCGRVGATTLNLLQGSPVSWSKCVISGMVYTKYVVFSQKAAELLLNKELS